MPPLHRHGEVTSTNDVLAALAQAGAEDGTALAAERQSAGKGRRGRSWTTLPGRHVLLSLLHRSRLPAAQLSGLTLDVGLAVAAVLAARGVEARLKWPNDVLVGGKKVGGILCELHDVAGAPAVVVGLGLNVDDCALPAELAHATTLAAVASADASDDDARATALDRDALLAALVDALRAACKAYEARGAPDTSGWLARAIGIGGRVRDASGREGVAQGLAPDGALLVRWDSAKDDERFVAGDLELLRDDA